MEKRMDVVKERRLANGLELTIYDASRRVAGDRWYVALVARIPVEVAEEDFQGHEEPAPELFKEFVEQEGAPRVVFEIKKERNFIDEREREAVFGKLLSELETHCLQYMANARFAQGIKRKRLQEFMERRKWWRE